MEGFRPWDDDGYLQEPFENQLIMTFNMGEYYKDPRCFYQSQF